MILIEVPDITMNTSASTRFFFDETFITAANARLLYLISLYGGLLIVLFGAATNVLNILTFCRAGLNNTLNLGFVALAASDFLYQVLYALVRLFGLIKRLDQSAATAFVAEMDIALQCFHWSMTFYDTSVVIVCYIALQRACLVAFPLTFRDLFSLNKSRVMILTLSAAMVICHLPVLATQGLQYAEINNQSRLVAWYSPSRADILLISDIFSRNILYPVAEVVSVVSVVVLANKLRSSLRFRMSMTSKGSAPSSKSGGEKSEKRDSPSNKRESFDTVSPDSRQQVDGSKEKNSGETGQSSSKEIQLIKSVTIVVAIFVVGNTALVLHTLAKAVFPFYVRMYPFLHLTVINSIGIINELAASMNIVVYLKTNREFRKHFVLKL